MRRKLGQHFLKDKKVLDRIIETIQGEEIKTIIEIGPGHGELTEKLAAAYPGVNIIAIEKDEVLISELEKKFAEKNIEIVSGDALKVLPTLAHRDIGEYLIVGNIPYYITGFLFRTLGEIEKKPKKIVLLIQKEVAERVLAAPPEMNRLAASVQFWAKPEMILIIPPGAFSPPPQVYSAVIQITPQKSTLSLHSEKYYQTVRLLFSQPRKTILNNISSKIPKKDSLILFQHFSISPQDRPQNLTISQIIEIGRTIFPD